MRLKAGHVWVYRSDIRVEGEIPPGALVAVHSERGRPIGSALYSSASQIALRMVSSQVLPDESALLELLRERIRQAITYRKRVVAPDAEAHRLIFSEADGLPGLIVDRYRQILSLQPLTQAMDRAEIKQAVLAELVQQLSACGMTSVVERVEPHIRELEQLPPAASRLLHGDETSTIYSINRIRLHYEALGGQKTGAFLDQRENYAAAARYAAGEALDAFCYQGGFALHLAAKCSKVTALDSSRPALEVAERNEQLNPGRPEIEWIEGNAFDFLKDSAATGKHYDTIVLDPPAFAKSKRTLQTALRGYKELNLRGLKMLRPGGVLVTCSCSYHLSTPDFLQMLTSAAADARRCVKVLEMRSQALDHPVVLGIPETHYLKCAIVTG